MQEGDEHMRRDGIEEIICAIFDGGEEMIRLASRVWMKVVWGRGRGGGGDGGGGGCVVVALSPKVNGSSVRPWTAMI